MAQQQSSSSNANNKAKKNKVTCMGCADEIDKNHTGVICVSDHHICPECAKGYVSAVFDEPARNIPLKCMICKADVITETFERQLSFKQNNTFLLYHMEYDPAFLGSNEIVASCPFCEYWEINTVNTGRLIYLCKAKGCKKSSCFWCKKRILNKTGANEEKVDLKESEVEAHFECSALAEYKMIWDKASEMGAKIPCPKCGIGGMKNNACTHMTCVKCRAEWCYVCGLSLDDLDKDPTLGANNIFGHNVDWKKNINRCPMWLNNVTEVDRRWPQDSDECVTFLHRIRTMGLLQQAIKDIGPKKFDQLCKKYNLDKNCGFDMQSVLRGRHVLIKRK